MKLRPLYKHQRPMLYYALKEKHTAFLVGMRLGKTLTTIRDIKVKCGKDMKVLIVAPLSVLGEWKKELLLEGETDFQIILGTKKARLEMVLQPKRWNIINYEAQRSVPEMAGIDWDVVVLDEAVRIKNPKILLTKFFLRNFKKVPHKYILSGLLNPESGLDMWCPLAFLYERPFGFGSYWAFRLKMFEQGWNNRWTPKAGTTTKMAEYLATHAYTLNRKDVGMGGKKIFQIRHAIMDKKTKKQYDAIQADLEYTLNGETKQTAYAMTKLMWLRQLANGWLGNEFYGDHKLSVLMGLLSEQLRKEKVVVWYTFNQDIETTGIVLDKLGMSYAVINGDVPPFERNAIINNFQTKPRPRILLMQVAVGQYGIDLSASDTAIFYSCPYSHSQRVQAEDRILNLSKSSPLLYIDLHTQDTVDAEIYNAVVHKRMAASAVNRILMRSLKGGKS